MRSKIPSLQTLLAFEAAARHLNFTKAAQELRLTQTAISHQIRSLEDQLGIKLFVRQRNSILLTSAASEYLESVRAAVSLLSESTELAQKNQTNVILKIACLPTYAVRCLIPALPDFQNRNPDISVHLTTTTNFDELDQPTNDVAIRYGAGNWPTASRVDLLVPVEIFPVCSPKLMKGLDPGLSEIQILASMRRLRTFYYSTYQDDWPAWFAASGVSSVVMNGETVFNSLLSSLEAAAAGAGIAMGRSPLVDSYISDGKLVAPFELRLRSNVSFYLTSPLGKARSRKVDLFREWALVTLGKNTFARRPCPVPAPLNGRSTADVVDAEYEPLSRLLARWKTETPDKLAVVDIASGRRLTFAELADVVDSVALQFLGQGIQEGNRVLLNAEDGVEKLILWLALWRVAAVVCPVELSRQRPSLVQHLFEVIEPAAIVSSSTASVSTIPTAYQAQELKCHGWTTPSTTDAGIYLDLECPAQARLPRGAALHDYAGICLSSGTTGEPKCVIYDHKAYWLNGRGIVDALGLTSNDRTLEYRSLDWYSTQILSLVPFLQTGLTLHLAPRYSRSNFARWVSHFQITVSVGVPTVINLLLQYPEDARSEDLASLRFMTCSTASLSTSKWIRFEQLLRVKLLNIYGSTEAGWICSNRHNDIVIGTVGRPMPGVDLEVQDSAQKTGAQPTGELTVAGPQVAVGILKPDGSIDPLRGRRLVTRDIGTMDETGRVRLQGRTDDLIIRGGVKIPPREIEDIVLMHPDVIDAAVVGVPDEIFGQVPVCYYVPRASFPADELLSYCARNLPRERVPAAANRVKELPRNARGKLLYKDLLKQWKDQADKNRQHSN